MAKVQVKRAKRQLSQMDPVVLTGLNGVSLTEAEVVGDLLRFLNSTRAFCRRHRIPFDEHVHLLQGAAQEWVVGRLQPYWDKAHRQDYVRFMRPEVRSKYAQELEPEARELAEASGAEPDELPRPAHLINVHRSFGYDFHHFPPTGSLPKYPTPVTARELLHKSRLRGALRLLSIRQRRSIIWVYNRLHLLARMVRRCDIPDCRRFFVSDGKAAACPLCRKRLSPKRRWSARYPDRPL